MANGNLRGWLLSALEALGGSAEIIPICRWVWEHHESDLRAAGDLLYEWQYEIRWEAYNLRREGLLRPTQASPRGVWELTKRA